MRSLLGVAAAALLLLSGCSGSTSEPTGSPESGKADSWECNQLSLDWANQSDGHNAEVAFGRIDNLERAHTFGVGQAVKLIAADCQQDLIREIRAGNAGVAATLTEIADCLRKLTPSVESQEFCNEALDTYEREVLARVDRARELIALDQADY